MQGFGRSLEAVVDFREDRDAKDALILDGKMWNTSMLKVTKKENAGNYTFSFLITSNREIFHIFPSSMRASFASQSSKNSTTTSNFPNPKHFTFPPS